MLFVYWLEENPDYVETVYKIYRKMTTRGDTLCTSIFAVGEILIGPAKTNDANLRHAIREYFASPGIELLPFNLETTEIYSRIRAENTVSAADAIHLATAAQARTDLFLTNDRRLANLTIPGIDFIAGLDTNIL